MPISLVFDRKVRDDWALRLKDDIQEAINARGDWWKNYRRSYENYRNVLPVKNDPWPGCSNLADSVTTRSCEQMIRRLVMFYVQSNEFITISPNNSTIDALDRAKKVEQFLRWQGMNELDYFGFVDALTREFVIGGSAFAITDWVKEERMVADVIVPGRDRLIRTSGGGDLRYVTIGQPLDRRARMKEILDEIFGANNLQMKSAPKKRSDRGGIEKWDVRFEERGRKKTAVITIDKRAELGDRIEVMAEIPRIVKNQPVGIPLTAERCIVPPGDHNIQNAEFVAIKFWFDWHVIQEKLKSREWHLDREEKAELESMFEDQEGFPEKYVSHGGEQSWETEGGAQDDQDRYVGVDSTEFRKRKVPVFKIIRKWPIAGMDPPWPEAQIWMLPRQMMVCRVHYDSVDNRSGMRNIIHQRWTPARNEFYGVSVPTWLESIQAEANAITNMMIDRENITNNPMIFVDHTAAFERDNLTYGPGDAVRVNSPRDNVLIPQWPSSTIDSLQMRNMLYGMAEDLTQISSESVGRSPDRPTAPRTARGQQLLLGERQFAISYQAESMGRAIRDFWKQVWSWDAMLLPENKEFRVMGTDEIRRFQSRDELRGDFEFRFEAGQAIMNDEQRRLMFTEGFQLTAPIAMSPPEAVTPAMRNMAEKIWKDRGVMNPDPFLPPRMEDDSYPLRPEQEHLVFMMGRPVTVHERDNDLEHFQAHLAWIQSPAFEQMPPQTYPAFERHLMEHRRRMMVAQTRGAGAPTATGTVQAPEQTLQGNPLVNGGGQGQPPPMQPGSPNANLPSVNPLLPIG